MYRNDRFFDDLNIYTTVLQLITMMIASNDATNSDLMQELQKQDNEYLEKIIEQNNRIIKLLEKSNE